MTHREHFFFFPTHLFLFKRWMKQLVNLVWAHTYVLCDQRLLKLKMMQNSNDCKQNSEMAYAGRYNQDTMTHDKNRLGPSIEPHANRLGRSVAACLGSIGVNMSRLRPLLTNDIAAHSLRNLVHPPAPCGCMHTPHRYTSCVYTSCGIQFRFTFLCGCAAVRLQGSGHDRGEAKSEESS